MAQSFPLTIDSEAICIDGSCGEVRRIVVDPRSHVVSHLVVEPKHRQGLGRLVPAALLDMSDGMVQLKCTTAEFERLEQAEETHFLPCRGVPWGPD
jgi:hypothetical protein